MRILLITLILLVIGLHFVQSGRNSPTPNAPDRCLACHEHVVLPGTAHMAEAIGCAVCHLGNKHALEKQRAHAGMLINPGDLSVADRTCGRPKCHPEAISRVRQSVMSTNQGIIRKLEKNLGPDLAADLYAKLCASCHFYRPRDSGNSGDPESDSFALRGGGCSGCHVVKQGSSPASAPTHFKHATLSARVPSNACVRCHNRSDRIGLSYFGRYESEGYGTPFAAGGPGPRRLTGGRFYLQLPADVHHKKGGMDCIDCHTHKEIMGDGTAHAALKEQLEISCADCHAPKLDSVRANVDEARRLARINGKVPHVGESVPITKHGTVLYHVHVEKDGRSATLYRKRDGKGRTINLESGRKPYHTLKGHEKLACQACHSHFMPRCIGCHTSRKSTESQWDKVKRKNTRGRWVEGRYSMRFENPPLGLAPDGRIRPYSPCDILYEIEADSSTNKEAQRISTKSISYFDPHSTQSTARPCRDCHSINAVTTYPSETISPCLPCHNRYDDHLYKNFRMGVDTLRHGQAFRCLVNHSTF